MPFVLERLAGAAALLLRRRTRVGVGARRALRHRPGRAVLFWGFEFPTCAWRVVGRRRDRSFVYGLVIRAVTACSADLASLVAFQVLMLWAASLMALFALREYLGVRSGAALVTSVVASVWPTHVVWTRFVMAETSSVLGLTVLLVVAFEYLRAGRWPWLLLWNVAGLATLSMRVIALPLVAAGAFGLPLVWTWLQRGQGKAGWARFAGLALHLAVSLVAFVVLHDAYKGEYARRRTWAEGGVVQQPAYSYRSGAFLVSFMAAAGRGRGFPRGGGRCADCVSLRPTGRLPNARCATMARGRFGGADRQGRRRPAGVGQDR